MRKKSKNYPSIPSKQPAVIPVFFATEMWERFGFYMTQGLLVLYMTSQVFGFSDTKSYAILGVFSALAWMMPIFGGYIASRVLDYEHAVTLGGFLLAIGYALLSLPHETFFYIALSIIATGTGFFKPSISSFLGDFYQKNDPRRENGYTIFYIGINLGILLSTITSGYIVRYFGWHMPFLFASIGMLVGTVTFVFGLYYLKNTHNLHRITPSVAHKNPTLIAAAYIAAILLTIISYEIIAHRGFANELMLGGGGLAFTGLIIYAFRYDSVNRNKLLACIFLAMISIVFWAIYMQMFFSLNLFIERAVNRHLFQLKLPTPFFISLESIFLVLVGFYFGHLWQTLSKKNKNPSIPFKFVASLFSLFIAFIIVYVGTRTATTGKINMLFIVFAYLFVAIGELLLSPIGLSMVTILAPKELVGLMMGVWFVSLGLGEKLAGVIASYSAIPKKIILVSSIDKIYGNAFFLYAMISLVFAVICLICVPFLNRLIKQ